VYRESLKPWLIADLSSSSTRNCRARSPVCYENLVRFCDSIAAAYGHQWLSQRQARTIRTRVSNSRMDEIFRSGLLADGQRDLARFRNAAQLCRPILHQALYRDFGGGAWIA
jgi:hypothetical protein